MRILTILLTAAVTLVSTLSNAEDIELYTGEVSQRTGNRPQVLLIFDNSGSMQNNSLATKPFYNPNINYNAVNGLSKFSEDYVYFVKQTENDPSVPVPDDPNEKRKVLSAINNCEAARDILATEGFFHGYVREYTFIGNSGSWKEIPELSGEDIVLLDCLEDVSLENAQNYQALESGSLVNVPDGYPIDGAGTAAEPEYYTTNAGDSNTDLGLGYSVTLYTDNYLRWYHNNSLSDVNYTRLQIAKQAVTSIIRSAPSVDFGIQIFNINANDENERDGGRIIEGLKETTPAVREDLVETIDDIEGETNTPLCEALYEASRYFGGKSVYYGDDDSSIWSYTPNTPPMDTSVVDANNIYQPPLGGCARSAYVIMITDGAPVLDEAADDEIAALVASADPAITATEVDGNSLPILAEWMNTNDINTSIKGEQHVTTYTIGFADTVDDAEDLLEATAEKGGGQFFKAADYMALAAALERALSEIMQVNSSFTSPAVAANNFDRTENLESVYYTMFLPDRGPRWTGNLKKLKLKNSLIVDANDDVAIDVDGNIKTSAQTIWSSSSDDGDDVTVGGVLGQMRSRTSARVIYGDIGDSNSMAIFNRTNLESYYGGADGLANVLDIDTNDIDDYLDWTIGKDVDDADDDTSTANRPDIFADPLHSRPLVINYGGSANNQDVRILIGTNAGVLHMFDDNGTSVSESWAFMPKEFYPNIKTLRANPSNGAKIYGVDGSPKAYIYDANGDGTINHTAGDKVWVFFGLRRGGNSYYALDVSNPDAMPTIKWHIDGTTTGYSRLGQTWSEPVITHIKHPSSDSIIPVLIVGGGYSINKDSDGVGTTDSTGNAVYVIDANSGALLWGATPDTKTSTNLNVSTLSDGIASSIAIMDSDYDGLTDRLYAADTGGNVWRVDMPSQKPFDTENPWSMFKLASLGGDSLATDRRFFSEPSIARSFFSHTSVTVTEVEETTTTTYHSEEVPYDAILVGSGNRASPLSQETSEKLFMLRDSNIITQSFSGVNTPSTILADDLFNMSANPFQDYDDVSSLTEEELLALNKEKVKLSGTSGWYYDLTNTGEKSLASASVVAGVAYYTSFTPYDYTATCVPESGGGKLYAFDLQMGTTIYDWQGLDIGDKVPDKLTPSFPPTDGDEPSSLIFVGLGGEDDDDEGGTLTLCPAGGDCTPCEGEGCPSQDLINLETMRTYIYIDESNN